MPVPCDVRPSEKQAKHVRMNGNFTTDPCMEEKGFDEDHRCGSRKVIYFSNGETLGESEDEEGEDDDDAFEKKPFSQSVDTANLSWKEYSWFLGKQIGKKSLQTSEYLGGKLASLLGLDAAKYQYAIDEFKRDEKKKDIKEDSLDAFVEDDAENINLAQRKSRKYGATNTPEVPSCGAKLNAVGTHNKGYQDDDS